MRSTSAILLVCTLFLATGPAVAVAAPDERAVVLPFVNATGEKSFYWIGEAFALGLSDHLLAAGIDTVAATRRREALDDLGMVSNELPPLASSLLLARRLNASLVVTGEVRWQEAMPSRIEIRGRVLDATVPSVGKSVVLRGEINELFRLQKQFASLLVPAVRGRSHHAQVSPLAALESIPLSSFETYIKAITTSDRQMQRTFLERSLEAAPTFAPALIARARLDLDEGKAQEALLWLDRVAVDKMAFPERYWLARADTAAARGDRGSARDLYHKALTRRAWPLAHFRLAAVLAQQGRLMESRREVEAGLLIDPGHPAGIELREALAHAPVAKAPS